MPRSHASTAPRLQRTRLLIAQTTARLIAEHGLSDWAAAKRKACRELGLPEASEWPANDEVEEALRNYNSLFRPDAQAASLREQRLRGLAWLARLEAWSPLLTGPVAAGWATEHSELALEVAADDAKEVELMLLNAGCRYSVAGSRGEPTSAAHLRIDDDNGAVRLTIVSPMQRRNRPKREEEVRLSARELQALLDSGAAPPKPGGDAIGR